MKKNIEVRYNVLSDSLFKLIKEKLESEDFPWYFLKNSAYPDNKELVKQRYLNYSFYHLVLNDKNIRSNYFDVTNAISLVLKDSFKLKTSYDLFRLRWGMTTSLNMTYKNTPHTDMLTPHKVILFYLSKSDGKTYFYDKEHNIIDSILPKENSAILFDGLIRHSSSKPVEFARRIVLNINLKETV